MNEATAKQPELTVEQLLIALGKRVAMIEEAARLILETFKPGPEYQRHLSEYPGFDWRQIGARPIAKDKWGVTVVEWNGTVWKRRSVNNKYGANIWFARCVGKEKTETGEKNKYAWLINFSDQEEDLSVEPLASNAQDALQRLQQRKAA